MPARKPRNLRESVPGFRRLGPHLRPHLRRERGPLLVGLLALFAEVGFRLLEPWPLKYVIDGVIGATGSGAGTTSTGNLTLLLVTASANSRVLT